MIQENKLKVFLDLDDTTIKSSKRFVTIANGKFNIDGDYTKQTKWDYSDIYPTITEEDVQHIYSSKKFYKDIEFQDGCIEALKHLSPDIELTLVTTGPEWNIFNKREWAEDNMSFIDYEYVGLIQNGTYNKSSVDMSGGIFIDDRAETLRNSNAPIKILYMPLENKSWQQIGADENVYVARNWKEVDNIISFFIKNKNFIEGIL